MFCLQAIEPGSTIHSFPTCASEGQSSLGVYKERSLKTTDLVGSGIYEQMSLPPPEHVPPFFITISFLFLSFTFSSLLSSILASLSAHGHTWQRSAWTHFGTAFSAWGKWAQASFQHWTVILGPWLGQTVPASHVSRGPGARHSCPAL